MTNNNPFLRFMEENNFPYFFDAARKNTPDWQAMIDMQRKNALAWSEAMQVTTKTWQNIAELNRKTFTQMTKENADLLRKMMSDTPPEKQMEENVRIVKNWIEKSAENTQKASSLLKKTQEQSNEILNERLNESVKELKTCILNDNKKESTEQVA